MVGFDYYQNLEKECSSLYYSILSRGLLEEFDTFVPDRVLYEKLWHAFMHPYIGSYDNFFYVPERPKPKHPRFLEEKPSRGECWEYRFKDGKLRYVLHLRDGEPYRSYFAVIPEGFAEFDSNNKGEYQYYGFYLTMEKGKRYLFFDISRLGSRFPKELQFEIGSEIMEIYPDPDQKGFELYNKEGSTYKHLHGYLYSQKSYGIDYCDSKFVNVDRSRKFFGSLGKKSAEWAEEVLKGILRNGFQPI